MSALSYFKGKIKLKITIKEVISGWLFKKSENAKRLILYKKALLKL